MVPTISRSSLWFSFSSFWCLTKSISSSLSRCVVAINSWAMEKLSPLFSSVGEMPAEAKTGSSGGAFSTSWTTWFIWGIFGLTGNSVFFLNITLTITKDHSKESRYFSWDSLLTEVGKTLTPSLSDSCHARPRPTKLRRITTHDLAGATFDILPTCYRIYCHFYVFAKHFFEL